MITIFKKLLSFNLRKNNKQTFFLKHRSDYVEQVQAPN